MGNIKNHLWFIYAYIAFLISLPLLRSLVSKLKEKDYYYMIGLVIIFNAIIPIVEYLIWKGKVSINQNIKVTWLFSNIVFYPCLGYFLQNEFKKYNNKKSIIFLWIVNIIGIIISCYMTYYRFLETGALKESNAQAFFNNFSFINCICIFITIKYVFENAKMPNWINKLIYSVGSCTFGIYLIHLLILNNSHMKKILVMLQQDAHINHMISVFIVCLCVMVISYIITFLLKKVIHIATVFGRNILEKIKKKEDNEN